MTKHKIQNKFKAQILNFKTLVLVFVIWILGLFCHLNFDICHFSFAQEADLEFTLDVNSKTIPLPKVFKPNMDLSGRGFHHQSQWPQELAASEVLDAWQKDIGFSGLYRLQYNLWEIQQLAKDKNAQDALLANYESVLKRITSAGGGRVILDIFGTPAGLGKVLDKKSPPWDFKAFKVLIKTHIKNLSCDKKYNLWYEVWSAPDLDDFFLGRKQEYLNMYRAVAEAVKELEQETKIHIPLGGPAVSCWFQNLDGNNIATPEKSLIYELIRFCYQKHLPLDFISWHSYSSDPQMDKESSVYKKKSVIDLIRDWLSYFHFDRNIPLIVDEWNFDLGANVLVERKEKSNVCASYIFSRLKNMYEAGIDNQVYFSLEDFQNNKENVVRNVGVFEFDPESSKYKGNPKSTYNVFRMLANLAHEMFILPKLEDEFAGAVATKDQDYLAIIIYNYLDPEIFWDYLSRNISALNPAERKALINLIKSDRLGKIKQGQLDVKTLRLKKTLKNLLNKAQELNGRAMKLMSLNRNIKLGIKNLTQIYLYQRYIIDSSCGINCEFKPVEEKEISAAELYQEALTLSPYSVQMVILKKKPPEPPPQAELTLQQPETKDTNTTTKEE